MRNQMTRSLLLTALLAGLILPGLPGYCGPGSPFANFGEGGGRNHLPMPPAVYNPPPPSQTPPPSQPPPPTTSDNPNLPLMPKDVTDLSSTDPTSGQNNSALNGVMALSPEAFPKDQLNGNGDYLLVRSTAGSTFHKERPYAVTLGNGQFLVSIRRPTRLAFATVQFGDLALQGDADILITTSDDMLRIVNMSGRGQSVKVKLDHGTFASQNANVIALAPGYEIVASSHILGRSDVRIADGFARRGFKILDDKHIAVSEISIESVFTTSSLVAEAAQDDNAKDRRVVQDMSKMAAVLNYINGTEGFTRDSAPTKLAHK